MSCEHFERCGETGHFRDPDTGTLLVCPCLEQERIQANLGELYSKNPLDQSLFQKECRPLLDRNIFLSATDGLASVRRFLHPAALELDRQRVRWQTLTLQRYMEIWLGKEEGTEGGLMTINPILDSAEHLFFFIGFGEMPNIRKPEGIIRILDSCELRDLTVWVISQWPPKEISTHYNGLAQERLEMLEEVNRGRRGGG